jgi:pimeloyl-ACP methyl ester carboxylesterase
MKHTITKGKGKGTIVFIHGNSSSSDVFKDIMQSEVITQTKIVVDLPGHGSNLGDFSLDEDFSITSYRTKLISFLKQIDDDILLVGNSLGGHLAIEIAKKVLRLKGLVIFGTPPLKKPANFEEAFLPVAALQTFFTENPSDVEIEETAKVVVFNANHIPNIINNFKQSNPKVRKAIALDAAENKFLDQYKIFTSLTVNKFIIVGRQDPSVNSKYLESIKNDCNKTCELIYFDECGHYASLEKPKEFINEIEIIANNVF